jgi:hypothetical protein
MRVPTDLIHEAKCALCCAPSIMECVECIKEDTKCSEGLSFCGSKCYSKHFSAHRQRSFGSTRCAEIHQLAPEQLCRRTAWLLAWTQELLVARGPSRGLPALPAGMPSTCMVFTICILLRAACLPPWWPWSSVVTDSALLPLPCPPHCRSSSSSGSSSISSGSSSPSLGSSSEPSSPSSPLTGFQQQQHSPAQHQYVPQQQQQYIHMQPPPPRGYHAPMMMHRHPIEVGGPAPYWQQHHRRR